MHHFTREDSHYIINNLLPQSDTFITQDVIPDLVDTPLALIVRICQGVCRVSFYS